MRKLILSAVLFLFLLVPASITWAQRISISGNVYEKGIVKNKFPTPHGTITIIWPDVIAPGDFITGTVMYDPAGENVKKKNNNYRELTNYPLSLPDGTPLSINPASDTPSGKDTREKTFSLIIPSDLSSLQLILKNPSGKAILESKIPLVSKAFLMPVEDVFSITGRGVVLDTSKTKSRIYKPLQFDTDKKIYMSGESATLIFKPLTSNEEILSAKFSFYNHTQRGQEQVYQTIDLIPVVITPRKAVIIIPPKVYGPAELVIRDENNIITASQKIHVLSLEAFCPKTNLLKGESTLLNVRVLGLKDYPADYLRLSLNNSTSNKVQLGEFNQEELILETVSMKYSKIKRDFKKMDEKEKSVTKNKYVEYREQYESNNEFSLQRNITALQSGGFTIDITLSYPLAVYNDPFRQQLDALKMPEQFNKWQDALINNLQQFYRSMFSYCEDREGNEGQNPDCLNIKRKIRLGETELKRPVTPDELDEAKSLVYSFSRSFNLPAEVVEKYFSCTLDAGRAAVQNAQNNLGNEPFFFEVMESALNYSAHQAGVAKDTPATRATIHLKEDMLKLQREINNANQLFQMLENIRKNFDDAANKALQNMRASVDSQDKPFANVKKIESHLLREGLIAYYNPVSKVFMMEAGKEQIVLKQTGAKNIGGSKYVMPGYNFYRDPVNCVFKVKTGTKLQLYAFAFESEINWNVLYDRQDKKDSCIKCRGTACDPCPCPPHNPCDPCPCPTENTCDPCPDLKDLSCDPCPCPTDNPCDPCPCPTENTCEPCPFVSESVGDTIKLKTGTTIIVYEGWECQLKQDPSVTDCYKVTELVLAKDDKTVIDSINHFYKSEFFGVGKCRKKSTEPAQVCVEFKVISIITTEFRDKECRLPIDVFTVKEFSCELKK